MTNLTVLSLFLIFLPPVIEDGPIAADAPPATASVPDDAPGAGEKVAREPRAGHDPCDVPPKPGRPSLDDVQRKMFEVVCTSARWFDGFFGDQRFDEEARRTHGRVGLYVLGDGEDGAVPDGESHINVEFPNLEHKLSLFFDRGPEDEYLEGRRDSFTLLPEFFRDTRDDEALLGLGYHPAGRWRSRFDYDAGVALRSPLEPFVQGRYRRYWALGDRYLVRYRGRIFWRNQRGFGTTSGVDLERVFGESVLLRFANRGTIHQETQGVDWRSALTVYHLLTEERAISYQLAVDGLTDHEVPVRESGFRVTYRSQMLRPWFFGELLAGVRWPRKNLESDRDAFFHVGLLFEIRFGASRP